MSSLERVGEVESVAEMITESVAESIVKVSLSRNARLTVSTRGPWARWRWRINSFAAFVGLRRFLCWADLQTLQ